jgi:hypothetical protein
MRTFHIDDFASNVGRLACEFVGRILLNPPNFRPRLNFVKVPLSTGTTRKSMTVLWPRVTPRGQKGLLPSRAVRGASPLPGWSARTVAMVTRTDGQPALALDLGVADASWRRGRRPVGEAQPSSMRLALVDSRPSSWPACCAQRINHRTGRRALRSMPPTNRGGAVFRHRAEEARENTGLGVLRTVRKAVGR